MGIGSVNDLVPLTGVPPVVSAGFRGWSNATNRKRLEGEELWDSQARGAGRLLTMLFCRAGDETGTVNLEVRR